MSDEALNTGGGTGDSGAAAAAPVSSSPSAESGPATIDSIFDEVSADLGDSPAPVSAETAPTPTPAPATAAQPEPVQAETPPPPSPGEPPKERWEAILNNTRTKVRDETLQEVVKQYGPSLQVVEQLRSDPVGTVVQLMTELQADPRFAQQMASHAARTLRASRQAAQGEDEPQPDLDAGNGVFLYSAQQQAKREAWLQAKWQREMQSALAPIQQDLTTRQQREQQAVERQQAVTATQQRLEKWAQQPHFQQHKDAIRAKQAELYQAGHEPWDALALAYASVVLPAQAHQQQQQTVAQAAQKLRAATPNPNATAPAASRKARSLDDAFDLALGELSQSA